MSRAGREAEMERRMRDYEQRMQAMEATNARLTATNERLLKRIEDQLDRGAPNPEDRLWKSMAANTPPKYDGAKDAVAFEDWVNEMEKVLELIRCPENRKVGLASFYLVGPAELWWRRVKANHANSTWTQFVEATRANFFPPSSQREKQLEFLGFKQAEGMTVQQYVDKFDELSRFAPALLQIAGWKESQFFDGLRFDIKRGIGTYTTFEELRERAFIVERIENEEKARLQALEPTPARSSKSSYYNSSSKKAKVTRSFTPTREKQMVWRCRACGKDHRGRACNGRIVCYICKKEGHISTSCPNATSTRSGASGSGSNSRGGGSAPRQAGLHAMSAVVEDLHEHVEGKAISGYFSVGNLSAHILFDSGADRSFISVTFTRYLTIPVQP